MVGVHVERILLERGGVDGWTEFERPEKLHSRQNGGRRRNVHARADAL